MPQNRQLHLSEYKYKTVYAFSVCICDDVFTKHGPPIMNLVCGGVVFTKHGPPIMNLVCGGLKLHNIQK